MKPETITVQQSIVLNNNMIFMIVKEKLTSMGYDVANGIRDKDCWVIHMVDKEEPIELNFDKPN